MAREYTSVIQVSGPIIIVEGIGDAAYGELVEVILPNGETRLGQVLESRSNLAIVQVFGGTEGVDTQSTRVRFRGEVLRLGVSTDMLGRIFDGKGDPIDGNPKPIYEEKLPISGSAINPYSRAYPREFIQTGITAIDLMNTLVRGQKLPIFTGSGLPHNEIAAQVARQAKVLGKEEEFGVVFAAMGITHEEASFFIRNFEATGAMERMVGFINLADDPAMERIITPQLALTAAEYLAFEQDMHMLVILIDMLKFAESLREISAARGEIPGRRGFPGYLYTTLATIYERAGRIRGRKGSITQMPILSMPGDDLTHPVPDLSGYICLAGETEILVNPGEIKCIAEFVDGFDISSGHKILCSKDLSPTYAEVGAVQKLPAPPKLLEIQLNSGIKIRATPDHRFLVDTFQGPKMIPAAQLKPGDGIFSLRRLELEMSSRPCLLEMLVSSSSEFIVHLEPRYMQALKQRLKERFGSLKRACRSLELRYSRIAHPNNAIAARELAKICDSLGIELKSANQYLESFCLRNGIRMKVNWRESTPELLYLLGLIASDGSVVMPHHLSFSNKNRILIEIFLEKFRKLFPELHPQITRNRDGTEVVQICSVFPVELARYFGLKSEMKRIFELEEEMIAAFLAGYFDGDGNCDYNYGRIRFRRKLNSDRDWILLKRLAQLLRRLGIPASISSFTQSKSSFGSGNMGEISVSGGYARELAKLLVRYAQHPIKRKALAGLIEKPTRPTKFEIAPLACSQELSKLRERYGIKPSRIESCPGYLLKFEKGEVRVSKSRLSRWLHAIQQLIGSQEELDRLRKLSSGEFILEKVKSISEVPYPGRYVYDLTVPGFGNFILETGIISSNCEGQLILSRDLHLKGIYPPMDVLPSLSRLMREGIGEGRTREDHRYVSDQLYAAYAEGRDMRALASIVGVEALTQRDRIYLEFADRFERQLISQGKNEERDIQQSLDLGWELLSMLPEGDLYKIPPEILERYHPKHRADLGSKPS